jgi:hypothetical protein
MTLLQYLHVFSVRILISGAISDDILRITSFFLGLLGLLGIWKPYFKA